jgi:cyclophilin family peptidyl-prolyl cis-trans isomerase
MEAASSWDYLETSSQRQWKISGNIVIPVSYGPTDQHCNFLTDACWNDNNRALCTGEKGMGKKGKPLHYKNSIFHRVIPQFMIQGMVP